MKRKHRAGKWRPYEPTDFDREKLVIPPVDFSKAKTAIDLRELQSLARIRKQREYERRSKKKGKQNTTVRRPEPGSPEWDREWREIAISKA